MGYMENCVYIIKHRNKPNFTYTNFSQLKNEKYPQKSQNQINKTKSIATPKHKLNKTQKHPLQNYHNA